jgi:hypothetical protein
MMQDGQTFEDVAILSNGRRVSMSKVGTDFIILPSSGAALNQIDLDVMYPKPVKPNRPSGQKHQQREDDNPPLSDHASLLGFDPSAPVAQEAPKRKKRSNFALDLLTRAKKNDTKITVELDAEMPTQSFFEMVNNTFDESTVDEVVDIIIDSIDTEKIRESVKNSIINFYGENK